MFVVPCRCRRAAIPSAPECLGPHQVTYEAEASLVRAEYVCAAQVWFYTIITKCNGPLAADITLTHDARHD